MRKKKACKTKEQTAVAGLSPETKQQITGERNFVINYSSIEALQKNMRVIFKSKFFIHYRRIKEKVEDYIDGIVVYEEE